ncbi:MAG: hypothetical protein A2286_09570 [Gammaproteobacteria bacterium RIFOXYA12_FULL_61_12]|nr:MAG: hypothetical protein A2514_14420 [Gammaproteobacteria bacterium RIFOXYD12_FULL_61_37]OGT93677.1 MAG: hypothetical protein A2286_09570 [Gammaproteobacteria bacterium RIFOXYA12_FULL_61_12]
MDVPSINDFVQPTAWNWLILCVVFVVLEIAAPGIFLLWLGVAAGTVGLVLLVMPGMVWEYQLLSFALFSVAAIVLAHRYLDRFPIQTDQPKLNRRGEQYVGRTFDLDAPIENGFGKIKVDDTTWKVTGEDCEAGTRVRVYRVDGAVLVVERFQALATE